MLSVEAAAKKLRCQPRTVRQAIVQGRLTAQKVARRWMIIEDARFRKFRLERPGRPNGLRKALALLAELGPIIQKGTRCVMDPAEVIDAIREERVRDLRGS
jgi:hypothetical protein